MNGRLEDLVIFRFDFSFFLSAGFRRQILLSFRSRPNYFTYHARLPGTSGSSQSVGESPRLFFSAWQGSRAEDILIDSSRIGLG